jgi:N-acetylglucosaminyldiphosphoundecaprenol N-acetyl-beta-D-mannosaminyltransferase
MPDALHLAQAWLRDRSFHFIATPGPEFLLTAQNTPAFKQVLNTADLSLPDGFGLRIGFFFNGQIFHHRVPGAEFVKQLLAQSARHHYRVYMLGTTIPGAGERAASKMEELYPGLVIAGHDPAAEWPWSDELDQQIVQNIQGAKPDILLVALAAPKQELWIARHRRELATVSIAIGVGRTVDYFAGLAPEPPAFFRRFGFEWFYTFLFARRFHQPSKRRKRVWNATWTFLKTVITQ